MHYDFTWTYLWIRSRDRSMVRLFHEVWQRPIECRSIRRRRIRMLREGDRCGIRVDEMSSRLSGWPSENRQKNTAIVFVFEINFLALDKWVFKVVERSTGRERKGKRIFCHDVLTRAERIEIFARLRKQLCRCDIFFVLLQFRFRSFGSCIRPTNEPASVEVGDVEELLR